MRSGMHILDWCAQFDVKQGARSTLRTYFTILFKGRLRKSLRSGQAWLAFSSQTAGQKRLTELSNSGERMRTQRPARAAVAIEAAAVRKRRGFSRLRIRF